MSSLFNQLFSRKGPKILCIAKNYFEHAKEMGASSVPPYPILFQKPLSSVIHEKENILLPPNMEVHHELELAVLIGKECKNTPKSAVYHSIEGYCLALDLTARNLQAEAKKNSWPWDVSKGFDTFLPLSGFISKDLVPDPYSLELELKINGVSKQKGSTGDMHYKISDIVSYISNIMTLYPGDLILTGTPAGVGPIRNKDQLQMYLRCKKETILSASFDVVEK